MNLKFLFLFLLHDLYSFRLYLASQGKIELPVNVTICGDLTIILYHARNALKGMGRPQGIKICQFQLNTGFIHEQETLLNLKKSDLDDLPDAEHIPHGFTVSLSIRVGETECLPNKNPPWIPSKPKRNPISIFSSQLEYEEMVDNFGKS